MPAADGPRGLTRVPPLAWVWAQCFRRPLPIQKSPTRYRPRLWCLDDRVLPSGSFGPESLLNTHVSNAQATFLETRQAVASDAAGNYVATWTSGSQDGSSEGVYAQRFSASGVPLGAEFLVNSHVQGKQQYPAVAMSATGSFVITWSSLGQDGAGTSGVYGQRFDAAGNPLGGEFLVNTTTAGNQQHSSVAMDALGRFVITWSSHGQDDNGSWGIYGQRYDMMGNALGSEFQVNVATAGDQTHSTVAMDAFGNFVITWESEDQDGDDTGIFARRFDAAGNALGSEFQVNTITARSQEQAHVAMHSAGNFVVTWASDAGSGDFEVFARRFDATGNPLGAEFLVNSTPSDDRDPTAAIAGSGDIIITWTRDQGSDRNIIARRFTALGAPVTDDFIVNTSVANDQEFSSVAPTAGGDFIVVWSGAGPGDGAGVFGRRLSATGIMVAPINGLVTTEAGGQASFSIVLLSQPSALVTIGLASTNPAEGAVAQPSVTFTPFDWNVPQIITVTGVDDVVADGAVGYSIVTAAASSIDADYDNVDPADVTMLNADNDAPGIIVSPVAGLATSEAGGAASFTVVLATAPSADVTIALSTSILSEANLSALSLTFTPGNWNVTQTVNVTGMDDDVDDGDIVFAVLTAPAVSADLSYAGIDADDIAVTNCDDDGAAVLVTAAGMSTTEAGGSATFTVVLSSQPTADVVIDISSDATGEGTVVPAQLRFTSADWNVVRTITVSGVDDFVVDGNVVYQVLIAAAVSADPAYDGLNPADLAVTNLDDDSANIVVTSNTLLTTTEGSGADSFTVLLSSQPTANVLISIASSDPGEGTPATASLTFTPVNWNVAQPVTVTGIDDAVDDGNVAYSISLAATSLDPSYDLFGLGNLAAINIDDDVAGLAATPLGDSVITEIGGMAAFCLCLDSQPTSDVAITVSLAGGGDVVLSQTTITFTPLAWNVPQVVTMTVLDGPPEVERWDLTLVASSADPAYQALGPITLSATNGITPQDPVVVPEPPSEVPPAESENRAPTLPADLVATNPPALPLASAAPDDFNTDSATVSLDQPVSATTQTAGSVATSVGLIAAEVAPAIAAPAAEPSAPQVPTRPPVATPTQAPSAEPMLPPVVVVVPQVNPAQAVLVRQVQIFNPTTALGLLETVHYETESWPTLVNTVFGVGLVASAGYVLLSTKASYWLLTAFAARPLWKQFDPMEVLFAWEEEQDRRRARGRDAGEEDESLQTMVDR